MALLTDPTFLIYQLRVAFLRSNDPVGERIVTFDDLASLVPAGFPSPTSTAGTPTSGARRKTSASEVRQQVARNTQANAYIVACGHLPETAAAYSPEVRAGAGLFSGIATPASALAPPTASTRHFPDGPAAGRAKRTNRSAKVAPTREGREEVVGLGVVPPHAELLGLGLGTDVGANALLPEILPRAAAAAEVAAARTAASKLQPQPGHAPSASMATIRLQRPSEAARKGSSRDAVALGIDFDVRSMFGDAEDRKTSLDSAAPPHRPKTPQQQPKTSLDGRTARTRRGEAAPKIPIANLRDDAARAHPPPAALKRSATLPAKRHAAAKPSRWADAQSNTRQPSGWVGGAAAAAAIASTTTWDASSSSDSDSERTPRRAPPRRGLGTHTWYGPRTGIRPNSLFPPPGAAVPPLPLLFGADDSDDDIDADVDDIGDGSARTPALTGLLRVSTPAAAPTSATASRRSSGASLIRAPRRASRPVRPVPEVLATSVPSAPSPLALGPAPTAVSGAQLSHLTRDAGPAPRPRGASDPHAERPDRLAAPQTREAPFTPPSPPRTSGLAALLAGKLDIRHNPFAEEFGAIVVAPGAPAFEMAVFVFAVDDEPSNATRVSVRVRQGATVEQAIGCVLLQLADTSALPDDAYDVVLWVLRIAEDGCVDDDFPVLDRARPVAQFAFDEFALCRATPEQTRANEALRMRHGRPPRMPTATPAQAKAPQRSVSQQTPGPGPGPRQLRYRVTPRAETPAIVLQQSRIATASTAGIFVGNPSPAPLPDSASAPAPAPTRFLKIHILGDAAPEALRTTTVEAIASATVAATLTHLCRKKPFSEHRYALGTLEHGRFAACRPDLRIDEIPPGAELCLQRTDSAPSEPQAAATPAVYHTFRVVRRTQMFTRHDRLLVIDADVVTIMPADHRTESAKTLTFHVSAIVCKRNQRSPKKLRLVVARRTSAAERSVDLEAETEDDALHICAILERARELYASNNPAI
ncbi:Component of a membrane-bound complex containing the Tor2p kinase [Coemansia sp. Benny D115]|nr:Component of a membrane-bound complex containing the Tor2p kinase [Coemansia sp. Benny D115]